MVDLVDTNPEGVIRKGSMKNQWIPSLTDSRRLSHLEILKRKESMETQPPSSSTDARRPSYRDSLPQRRQSVQSMYPRRKNHRFSGWVFSSAIRSTILSSVLAFFAIVLFALTKVGYVCPTL
jgi:hypothetical protein